MTGCASHGELVGPYVLGALEPSEMEELRRHLDACPRCAAHERELARVPALLDLVQADEATAVPPPELEEAVLDRFVRERAPNERPGRRWPRIAIPAVAIAAVVLALAIAVLPGGSSRAYARAELWGMPAAGQATGTAAVAEVDAGTRVKLRARGLPRKGGPVYELWCIRDDGRWVSGGSFRARADGSATAELTAAVRPGEYHDVVVTRRSAAGERGAEVMRGKLVY